MCNGQGVNELVADFPKSTNRRAALEWLVRVFELWDEGVNEEVTTKRHKIASLVGKSYQVVPNPHLDQSPPNHEPGNSEAAEWLLVYAINALLGSDLGLVGVHCWFFVGETKLGRTQ